jgi:hypothetical protein
MHVQSCIHARVSDSNSTTLMDDEYEREKERERKRSDTTVKCI